jgi:hypothetical protein
VVVFPVIFGLVIIGALLSGGAHAIRTNGDLGLPPSAGASPGPGDTSGMC